jgi:ESS family glutamate:Na+ symporter
VATDSQGLEGIDAGSLVKNITLVLVAMGLGSVLSTALSRHVTLPAYIGAMIVAAAIRNLDDATGWFRPSPRAIDVIGAVVLSLFLTMP